MEILTNFYKLNSFQTSLDYANQKGPYILHLYDTPSYAYYLLDKLLSKGSIIAVIHSGNLSSTLKVKQNPSNIKIYEEHLNLFNALLKHYQVKDVGISLSAYDHSPSVKRCLNEAKIYTDIGEIEILNRPYYFSYDAKNFSLLSKHEHLSQFISPYPQHLKNQSTKTHPFIRRQHLSFELISVFDHKVYPVFYAY